jgi:hypothetical protein
LAKVPNRHPFFVRSSRRRTPQSLPTGNSLAVSPSDRAERPAAVGPNFVRSRAEFRPQLKKISSADEINFVRRRFLFRPQSKFRSTADEFPTANATPTLQLGRETWAKTGRNEKKCEKSRKTFGTVLQMLKNFATFVSLFKVKRFSIGR